MGTDDTGLVIGKTGIGKMGVNRSSQGKFLHLLNELNVL